MKKEHYIRTPLKLPVFGKPAGILCKKCLKFYPYEAFWSEKSKRNLVNCVACREKQSKHSKSRSRNRVRSSS